MSRETCTFLGLSARSLCRRAREQASGRTSHEEGATAAEYAVLIAVIAAVIFVGAAVLGASVNAGLNDFGTELGTL